MAMTATQMVRRVTNRLDPHAGCTDGGCVFGHPGGMRTNGGCGCIKETNIFEMRRQLMLMARVAATLAATCPEDSGG